MDSALQGFLYYPQHLFSNNPWFGSPLTIKLWRAWQHKIPTEIFGTSILDALERDQLLWEWNRTQAEYPYTACMN
ncbi:MAG: hypothetical protein R3B74_13605 [Nitrospirales bacterium]|nr:hypothetical protein [Nitrospirales bacterium]